MYIARNLIRKEFNIFHQYICYKKTGLLINANISLKLKSMVPSSPNHMFHINIHPVARVNCSFIKLGILTLDPKSIAEYKKKTLLRTKGYYVRADVLGHSVYACATRGRLIYGGVA